MTISRAVFNTEDVLLVNNENLKKLVAQASAEPLRRFRLCMHKQLSDQIQEMVIVVGRNSYVRPHRHPPHKTESYHILQGKMLVTHFDDSGRVIRQFRMGNDDGDVRVYRLSASIWHTVIPLTDAVVYHETFIGPFQKDTDVEYADWAPPESDQEAGLRYLEQVRGGGNES